MPARRPLMQRRQGRQISDELHRSSFTLLQYAIAFSIIFLVSKAEKILEQMQNSPLNWRIESLKTVANAYSIEWRQRGTSHVVFVRSDGRTLPVPAHRPIKPIYIKKFVDFVMG